MRLVDAESKFLSESEGLGDSSLEDYDRCRIAPSCALWDGFCCVHLGGPFTVSVSVIVQNLPLPSIWMFSSSCRGYLTMQLLLDYNGDDGPPMTCKLSASSFFVSSILANLYLVRGIMYQDHLPLRQSLHMHPWRRQCWRSTRSLRDTKSHTGSNCVCGAYEEPVALLKLPCLIWRGPLTPAGVEWRASGSTPNRILDNQVEETDM